MGDNEIKLRLSPAMEMAIHRALDEVKSEAHFTKHEMMRLEALKLAVIRSSLNTIMSDAKKYYEFLKNEIR